MIIHLCSAKERRIASTQAAIDRPSSKQNDERAFLAEMKSTAY